MDNNSNVMIMEKKKITIIAVIAVVAIVIIAAAAWALTNNKNDNKSTPTTTFLIEDQYGVYFWVEGSGDDCGTALTNGIDAVDGKIVSTTSSYGMFVSSINGLAQTSDYSYYWALYTYSNGTWTSSEVGLSSLKVADNEYLGLFYVGVNSSYAITTGGPSLVSVPDMNKAAVWNGKTTGMLFTFQSQSGLYFYVNGSGSTAYAALNDANSKYDLNYKSSYSSKYSAYGVDYLFNEKLNLYKDDSSVYHYWIQKVLKSGSWIDSPGYLSNVSTSDYTQMIIYYGVYGDNPSAPIHA